MTQGYAKIFRRIWDDEKFRALTSGDKLTALYLLSGPSNRVGFFVISVSLAAEKCRVRARFCQKSIRTVCDALGWLWDERTNVILIPTWWKWNHPPSYDALTGYLTDLQDVPRSPLWAQFIEGAQCLRPEYRELFAKIIHRAGPWPGEQPDEQPGEQPGKQAVVSLRDNLKYRLSSTKPEPEPKKTRSSTRTKRHTHVDFVDVPAPEETGAGCACQCFAQKHKASDPLCVLPGGPRHPLECHRSSAPGAQADRQAPPEGPAPAGRASRPGLLASGVRAGTGYPVPPRGWTGRLVCQLGLVARKRYELREGLEGRL
jgi:hypothetical protein